MMDISFDNVKFPTLSFLYVNGNNIVNPERFLDESLKASISELGVARCNLRSLPHLFLALINYGTWMHEIIISANWTQRHYRCLGQVKWKRILRVILMFVVNIKA